MAEELRLVESWDELGPGMKVVLKRCSGCDRDHHHFMLLRDVGTVTAQFYGTGEWVTEKTFTVAPDPHPELGCGRGAAIGLHHIQQKRLYRVVDGLDLEKDLRDVAALEEEAEVVKVCADADEVMQDL